MTSQGHSQKVGTTGCPCVPARPASFIFQCLPARQQEYTSKDKWLLYKVSISDSSMLHSTDLCPLLPFLLTLTAHPAGDGEVNTAPSPPSYQQQICLLL